MEKTSATDKAGSLTKMFPGLNLRQFRLLCFYCYYGEKPASYWLHGQYDGKFSIKKGQSAQDSKELAEKGYISEDGKVMPKWYFKTVTAMIDCHPEWEPDFESIHANRQDLFTLKNIRRQRKELMSFLGHYDGNGNNEEDMFKWLFNEVLPQQREFTTADVLCISDFGWAPVSAETYAKINDYKSKGMIFYGLDTDGIGLRDFTLPYYIAQGEGSALPPDIIDSMWLWLDGKGKCIEDLKDRKKNG